MNSFATVIICGGGGLRLWPLSRTTCAKPFVRLPGFARPLLADTFARIAAAPTIPAATITVAAAGDLPLCRQIAQENAPAISHFFVGEPEGRDTAPAIATAAATAAKRFGENTPLLILPADHAIANANKFWQAAESAAKSAKDGKIVLLGIPPDYAATGYGYIERGAKCAESESVFAVKKFVEKPNLARAEEFAADENFFWNAGIFCFTPKTLFAELQNFAPEIYSPLQKLQNAQNAQNEIESANESFLPPHDLYSSFPKISFDYAVMEKTKRAAVVPAANVGWSDVGSWRAVAESLPADANGNRNFANAEILECENSFFAGGNRLIAAVGVRDLHIIDTPDALLVSAADSSEKVRELAARLQKQNRRETREPAIVRRPWGEYEVLSAGAGYKVKRISVLPGGKLSLQSHRRRSEHWTTVAGVMTITIDDREFAMATNESCNIPANAKHRMANDTDSEAAIIEVQIGDYLEEDDIIRYEDIYGRV